MWANCFTTCAAKKSNASESDRHTIRCQFALNDFVAIWVQVNSKVSLVAIASELPKIFAENPTGSIRSVPEVVAPRGCCFTCVCDFTSGDLPTSDPDHSNTCCCLSRARFRYEYCGCAHLNTACCQASSLLPALNALIRPCAWCYCPVC